MCINEHLCCRCETATVMPADTHIPCSLPRLSCTPGTPGLAITPALSPTHPLKKPVSQTFSTRSNSDFRVLSVCVSLSLSFYLFVSLFVDVSVCIYLWNFPSGIGSCAFMSRAQSLGFVCCEGKRELVFPDRGSLLGLDSTNSILWSFFFIM